MNAVIDAVVSHPRATIAVGGVVIAVCVSALVYLAVSSRQAKREALAEVKPAYVLPVAQTRVMPRITSVPDDLTAVYYRVVPLDERGGGAA